LQALNLSFKTWNSVFTNVRFRSWSSQNVECKHGFSFYQCDSITCYCVYF